MLNPGVINMGRHICQETLFLVQHKNITLERDYLMINYFKFRMCDEGFAIYDLIQTKCFLDLGTPMFGGKNHCRFKYELPIDCLKTMPLKQNVIKI